MKLGKQQEHQRSTTSIRSKAAHFVSDLTTVLLNPISDKPSSNSSPRSGDVSNEPRRNTQQCNQEEDVPVLVDGPDTSSFTAFLYSFLSPGRSENESEYSEWNDNQVVTSYRNDTSSPNVSKENNGKKGLFSKGKQSLGKALSQAARFSGYRSHASGKVNTESKIDDMKETSSQFDTNDGVPVQNVIASFPSDKLPKMSEPSQLMTENTRSDLYVALPVLSQGKKWVLLYSTWRHGISLSTLYRRSNLCPGLSLLVVGDRKGAVFGGLVEAPLKPSTKKRYQGSNDTFVFTNTPGRPVIYRPTGVNRYFTLCSTEYLALGGGNHFALYLDSDLLNGSSLASETYGNSCLSHTQEFEVKEIELWGFVYASEYEEAISMLRTEAPGICRW
ncbi:uncharacterized protein LOC111918894 [Lactuca sativa]|uniref:Oxidation resistance protein 1 n=1 Tax=Lactuca sativa TaxID=4236 RepID=A0A9R1W5X2_LACSA|nr:uncharacterized protein LOC111918894 [Lactuca sativa]KAJ0220432.1 hypothetical protein LSAT_V11C200073870 [Lactuca sativa]